MAVNVYGHFSRHPKKIRVRSQAIPASAPVPGAQSHGPINFGITARHENTAATPNFLKALECTNKFLGDGAQVTITILTR